MAAGRRTTGDKFADAGKAPGTRTLKVGKHFEAVILATGVAQVARACVDGTRGAPRRKWTRMRAEVKTVATKHAQVWLREDTEGLGWYRGPVLLTALGTPSTPGRT